MKHFIFILSLSIAVLLVIGALFLSKSQTPQSTLSVKTLLHPVVVSASGATDNKKIYAGPDAGLSLADSLYASKDSVVAIQTGATQSGSTKKINLTSGLVLLALENQFTPVQVITPRLTIDHRSKGLYYIDIRTNSTRVYSLTAILKLAVKDAKNDEITSLTLLPSQYFVLDENIDLSSLREADIYRISQLQTLAIAPVKLSGSYARVFGTQASRAKMLFDEMSIDRTRTHESLSEFRKSLTEPNSDTLLLFEKYGAFFVNDQKKIAIYQSLLAQKLQKLLLIAQTNCALNCQKEVINFKKVASEITNLKTSLVSFTWVNKDQVNALITDYVLLLSLQLSGNNQALFDVAQKTVTQFARESNVAFLSPWVYAPFNELYTRYIFGDLTEAGVAEDFQRILGLLIDSRQLPDAEFSVFIFFLDDYLSSTSLANSSQITLFKQFIQIAKWYIPTIRDTQKRSVILQLFFYSFWGIGKHLKELMIQEYFTSDFLQNTELKPQFVFSWSPNIPVELISALNSLKEEYNSFDAIFKDEYQSAISISISDVLDNRNVASLVLTELNSIYNIFSKYVEYRTNVSLGESARNATGLEVKKEPLSRSLLTQYLNWFAGLDSQSIAITNDIGVDDFYQVTAKIFGRDFSFRLNPQGHVIEKIIITDGFTENRNYERVSLNMDDRAKYLNEMAGSVISPEEREKYDIKNFFKYTFSDTPWYSPSTTPSIPKDVWFNLTPQMKLFVQSELIEKDFFLLKDILTIPISRVNAQIEGGEYKIQLHNIGSSLTDDSRTFALQMNSGYIFSKDTHAFSDIEFTVKNEQGIDYFGGSTITLLPQQIPNQDFAKRWAELKPFLGKLTSLVNENSNISIDLDARTLTINGVITSL